MGMATVLAIAGFIVGLAVGLTFTMAVAARWYTLWLQKNHPEEPWRRGE